MCSKQSSAAVKVSCFNSSPPLSFCGGDNSRNSCRGRRLDGTKGVIASRGAGDRFIVEDHIRPGIGRLARSAGGSNPPTPPPNDALLPPRLPPEGDADAGVLLGQRIGGGADGRSAVLYRSFDFKP